MSPAKKQRLSDAEEDVSDAASSQGDQEFDSSSDGEGDSPDTGDELEAAKYSQSKQTLKRKRRATEPSKFGATLVHLLNTEAPSSNPLSLKPTIARKLNDEKLEIKAKKVLAHEKKEREDKGRIRDVIGGWGGESERGLRKVAQRGVVKLFNVIQQSQAAVSAAAEDSKATRGTGKPSLPAPQIEANVRGKGKKNDNIIGRGKESAVGKDDFFDMIRSGGLVSKS